MHFESSDPSFCSALHVFCRGNPPEDPQVPHLLTPELLKKLEGVTLDQVRGWRGAVVSG